jgi:hypothetical protein
MRIKGAYDIIIGVKRVPDALAQAWRGRLVWDIVDAFPQPHGNHWSEAECKTWLSKEVRRLSPIAIIAATRKMAEDCALFGVPVLWLPHHYRPGIKINPIRERIEVIGYEGGLAYIERWRSSIDRECNRIGARFVVNPQNLADLDVVLALRGETGYAPRNWKSNVKLSNAHGSGTPWIGGREAGYLEMATGSEQWADTPQELRDSIDSIAEHSKRQEIGRRFLESRISLEQVAEKLLGFLHGL